MRVSHFIVADRCCEPVVNRPDVVWSAASSKSCEGMSKGFMQLANETNSMFKVLKLLEVRLPLIKGTKNLAPLRWALFRKMVCTN